MAFWMALYAGDDLLSVKPVDKEKEERVELLPNARLFYAIVEADDLDAAWEKGKQIGLQHKYARKSR